MAVIDLIAELKRRLGIGVADDELDGRTFTTVGSLWAFVELAERVPPGWLRTRLCKHAGAGAGTQVMGK